MKYVILIVRILLGLIFVFFGSNGFLHFLHMPPMPGAAGEFLGVLAGSGYLYVIAGLQVLGGLLLLLGARFVALGLTLLGPVIVNIVLFHIFLAPQGLPLALVVSILSLFLLWVYRYKFPSLFRL